MRTARALHAHCMRTTMPTARALHAHCPQVAQRDLKRLRRMSPMHSEYSTLVEYLETIADLPWNRSSDASISLAAAEAQLAEDHFGMAKVKEP